MSRFKKILPLVILTVAVLISFAVFFWNVYRQEVDGSWEDLEETAHIVQDGIQTKFDDEIMKLHLIETIFRQRNERDTDVTAALSFLENEQSYTSTVFSQIDVIESDRIISVPNDGKACERYVDFDEAFARREGMTERYLDSVTGKYCVSYVLPVEENGERLFAVVGVIELERLYEFFAPSTYGENINICLIDAKDGNYLIDSWHSTLGNLYEMGDRELLRRYRNVDFRGDIKALRSGHIAFESQTTGSPLCMYYTPAGMFDWEIAIFVDSRLVFEDAYRLVGMMTIWCAVNAVFIALYFIWNIHIVNRLEKSVKEVQSQKEMLSSLTYRDDLTAMYNRRKFMEDVEELRRKTLSEVGVIYMDLNGLKVVNDLFSHERGDAYLRSASEGILSVFPENSYRIGGDEFIVVAEGTERQTWFDRVERLKQTLAEREVNVSVGVSWRQSCTCLEEMIGEAESFMYAEKKKHYQEKEEQKNSPADSEV